MKHFLHNVAPVDTIGNHEEKKIGAQGKPLSFLWKKKSNEKRETVEMLLMEDLMAMSGSACTRFDSLVFW